MILFSGLLPHQRFGSGRVPERRAIRGSAGAGRANRMDSFTHVLDATKYINRVSRFRADSAATSNLRSAAGKQEPDELRTAHQQMNAETQNNPLHATEVWGVEVNRTEIVDGAIDEARREAHASSWRRVLRLAQFAWSEPVVLGGGFRQRRIEEVGPRCGTHRAVGDHRSLAM